MRKWLGTVLYIESLLTLAFCISYAREFLPTAIAIYLCATKHVNQQHTPARREKDNGG